MGGAAGGRALILAEAANCLLLCHLCHRWIESHRDVAFAEGWLVSLGDDPREIPATIYRRGPQLLGVEYRPLVAPSMRRAPRAGRLRVSW